MRMAGIGRRPLPWTALQAFEAASRLGSFKDAAVELSVTPTAISHQMKRLEAQLGLVLFERKQRPLVLTDAGRLLARETKRAFSGVESALLQLAQQGSIAHPSGLTLSVVPSFATKWLAPRLLKFQKAHTRIGLRVIEAESLVDFRRDRTIDVALRYGPGGYGPGVHEERLWPNNVLLAVCAPRIARRYRLKIPRDIGRQTLIRTALPTKRRASKRKPLYADWRAWFEAAGITLDGDIRGALDGPVFGTTQLALEAAMAGHGIALAPSVLVEKDIAAGRLVSPFPIRLEDPNAFWVVCRKDRAKESHVRAFIAWLRREALSGCQTSEAR
jgi:DNA-binding transcriptional LysR family regulator